MPDQRFTDLIEIGGVALDDDGVEYVQFRIYNSNIPKERIDILSKWERIDMVKGNPNWNKRYQGIFRSRSPYIRSTGNRYIWA